MRIELLLRAYSDSKILPINYQLSDWKFNPFLDLLNYSSKVRLKKLQSQLNIILCFNSYRGSIKRNFIWKITRNCINSYSIILNKKVCKMKLDRIIKILEIFKDAEKGLDKKSSEFSFLPGERIEFYFDLLEKDFGFIKKFEASDKNMKYRITANGYKFYNRETKTQNKIGF